MKNKIQPRYPYVLIKPASPENRKNELGLILPSNVEQEQKAQGEVLAVPEGLESIKKGDTVIFGAYAGETLKVNENNKTIEYKLIHQEDIIAFIK